MSEKTTAERFAVLRDALLHEAELCAARLKANTRNLDSIWPEMAANVAAVTEAAAAAQQAMWLCEQGPVSLENQKKVLEINRAILEAQRRAEENKP